MRLIINILYRILELLNKKSNDKIIRSHLMDDALIWTNEGWTPASYIHMTKPFKLYEVVLEDELKLRCADEHILFYDNYKEVKCIKSSFENTKYKYYLYEKK